MYKEHSNFEKPSDETKIWRYMDFTKFMSLIDKEALFFCRADRFSDPFEGSVSKANIRLRPAVYKDAPKEFFQKLSFIFENVRKCMFINCWHMNEYESAAMWDLYLKTGEGIAIQSTFKQLKESFHKCKEHDIFIGKVKYIDYNKDWLPEGNLFYPFLHKRKSFEHERELRAIIDILPENEEGKIDFNKELPNGLYIPIDLSILIEKIYISPTAPEWFGELVYSIVKKYNLKKEVVRSSLAERPVY